MAKIKEKAEPKIKVDSKTKVFKGIRSAEAFQKENPEEWVLESVIRDAEGVKVYTFRKVE